MENKQLGYSDHNLSSKKYPLCILAHDMDVPTNVGSLFRVADALGVEKIYLTGRSIVPPNSKLNKTSRFTEKVVNYSYIENPIQVISRLKGEGFKVISLEITSLSIEISNLKISNKDRICLILGSEKRGVCQRLLDVSDVTVHIPMLGKNSSMNVANACSIAIYEITKKLEW